MIITSQQHDAPVVPSTDIMKVIKCSSALHEPITYAELIRNTKVPRGNASSTLKALKSLGLLDLDGRKTLILLSLERASPEEFRMILRKILEETYFYVFDKIGPTGIGEEVLHITREELNSVFEPSEKRSRMAALFVGLADKAGWKILLNSKGVNSMPQNTDIMTEAQTDNTLHNSTLRNLDMAASHSDREIIRVVFDDLLESLGHLIQIGEDTSLTKESRRLLNEVHHINLKSVQRINTILK
ncbi:MAG: hypothetical protein ACYDER_26730 [Ktedonobacteraceae bacterium]